MNHDREIKDDPPQRNDGSGSDRDTLSGGNGNAPLFGERDRDGRREGDDEDPFQGTDDPDHLFGDAGSAARDGNRDDDRLTGGDDDILEGEGGIDRCVGDSAARGDGPPPQQGALAGLTPPEDRQTLGEWWQWLLGAADI